jgi:hypothetical protein
MMGCTGFTAPSRRREAVALLSLVSLHVLLATDSTAQTVVPADPGLVEFGVGSTTPTSVSLTWTAVGDDGHTGTATYYDLRYAVWDITEENWDSTTQVSGEPDPQPSGSAEAFTVTDLAPGTTYFFALKVGDEVPNWSALSNVASAATLPLPDTTALALSDIPVASTVAGDYTFTHESDDAREEVSEVPSSTQLRRWYSTLDHRWGFQVPAGSSAIFHLEASRPDNSDGDNFAFEYSTNGSVFTHLVTVASPVEQTYCVPLPSGLSGAVVVRVVDTNHVQGRQSLDRICIDYMDIETTSGETMHVHDMLVTHGGTGIKQTGICTVWIHDQADHPVIGATVCASYSGPTTGSRSGVTGQDGSATIESPKTGPSPYEWCFEVTGVTQASYAYDPTANVVTTACESGWIPLRTAPSPAQVEFVLAVGQFVLQQGQQVLQFSLPEPAHVELQVFSAGGRRVATLVDDWRPAGVHEATLDASGLGSGVYFLRLEAGDQRDTRRVMLIK